MQTIQEADVQTIELHTRVFNYKEGTNVYARAKLELPAAGKVVSLKFVSQSKPFDNTGQPWDKLMQQPEAESSRIAIEVRAINAPHRVLEEIKEVLVNLDIPESNLKWVSLCYPIGEICRMIFPNLNAANSALIVHEGFKRYHNDEALLSSECLMRLK